MTPEITSQLPPCPLPDCEGGEHHYHDVETYAAEEGHDCARTARGGFCCYGPSIPSIPQWQSIELAQIKAGMRIRATVARGDLITTHTGVAHHADTDGDWLTEENRMLTGWSNSVYEVDPTTIPDPDAELIEAVAETLYRTDWPSDMWDGLSVEAYREVARAALAVIRAEEAGEQA